MKDPYVYQGTNVLINKLNIKDGDTLDKAESDFAGLAANRLRKSDFQIDSILDGLKIHKYLFSNLYEWAGQPRTIDIYKGESILNGKSIDYVFASYITQALKDLDKEYQSVDWKKLNSKEKIEKVCYFVSEFWHIHPFREGNTRTTTVFLYLLMKQIKLKVNIDFIGKHSKYFRNALVLASIDQYSEYEHLEAILMDSISLKKTINGEEKYQTIRGYDLDKYEYNYHHIKED